MCKLDGRGGGHAVPHPYTNATGLAGMVIFLQAWVQNFPFSSILVAT